MSASLAGRVIVLTRRKEQGRRLREALLGLGATVIEVPGLEIAPPLDPAPLDEALRGLERFDWVAFTSANAVRAVARRLEDLALPVSIRGRGPRVAAVGGATEEAFREAFPGERTDLQPAEDVRAAGLLRAFAAQGVGGKRVLLPVSSQARRELEHGLREGGAIVERVVAYRTVAPEGAAPALKACLERDPDLFVFASPSAVEGIAAVSAGGLAGRPAVVIGPTTEAAARQAGLRVLGVASQPTVEGLLQAVVLALGRRGEERDSLTRRP